MLTPRHQLFFFFFFGSRVVWVEDGKVGQSTTPQGSRGWKEGKHVCDFGFIGGAGV